MAQRMEIQRSANSVCCRHWSLRGHDIAVLTCFRLCMIRYLVVDRTGLTRQQHSSWRHSHALPLLPMVAILMIVVSYVLGCLSKDDVADIWCNWAVRVHPVIQRVGSLLGLPTLITLKVPRCASLSKQRHKTLLHWDPWFHFGDRQAWQLQGKALPISRHPQIMADSGRVGWLVFIIPGRKAVNSWIQSIYCNLLQSILILGLLSFSIL